MWQNKNAICGPWSCKGWYFLAIFSISLKKMLLIDNTRLTELYNKEIKWWSYLLSRNVFCFISCCKHCFLSCRMTAEASRETEFLGVKLDNCGFKIWNGCHRPILSVQMTLVIRTLMQLKSHILKTPKSNILNQRAFFFFYLSQFPSLLCLVVAQMLLESQGKCPRGYSYYFIYSFKVAATFFSYSFACSF